MTNDDAADQAFEKREDFITKNKKKLTTITKVLKNV
jgi:hypothetical protein